jgi:2-dehydropantoate 2-reductase
VSAIGVLGPGGVGGFIAAALARAGEHVVVIAREPTAEAIATSGIAVQSARLGEFTAYPDAVSELQSAVDVLLVATKATTLDAALERIETDPGLVVPLMNGLEHMDRLRNRFGAGRVAAGVIRIESDRPAAGRIVQTSPSFRVDLATDDPALQEPLERLAETFRNAGVETRIGPSEKQVLWSKLVRLNALACTTSAADRPIGVIRSDPEWRATLTRCISETAAVANADGAQIDPASALRELDAAHAELGSSMQRDLAAGREPELDAIAGAVIRAGARYDLRCPTVERLSAEVAARAGMARGGGLR